MMARTFAARRRPLTSTAVRIGLLAAAAALAVCALPGYGQDTDEPGYNAWWRGGFRGRWRRENPQARALPLIRVEANRLVDPDGETVLLRGLAISDPDKLVKQEHWNREHFGQVKEMGAMVVRIPVHPVAWRERTPMGYLELLDQAVEWCTELEMYVIIDWHSIGNLGAELFQHPMYETTRKETFEFWRAVALRFRGHNTVAFYELFNEPTIFRGGLGKMSWTEWKGLNEDMIDLIRAYDTETIPLVAGFDWAYDLSPLRTDPVDAEGIGYVTHPYETKRPQPWEPRWEENFAFAAERYPVIATEFGFRVRGDEPIGEDHYANRIVNFLEERGISWVAWCFDPEWGPRMLQSWDPYVLSASGEFFKEAMHREPRPRLSPEDER
jgi:endoglucanase